MSSIDQIRDREARGERQVCLRALLQTPLLLAEGTQGSTFRLIRRHADWLRAWFAAEPAWPLVVEQEYARLSKIPARLDDPSFPARDHKGLAFSRRRYVLLCMVLAVLEKAERQTILGHIAEQVAMKLRGDELLAGAGMDVHFERRAERIDLIAVIRMLVERGVLTRIHGDEEGYVQHAGEVLYTINRSVLARIAVMQCGPSTLPDLPNDERPIRLHPSELFSEGDAARRRRSRTTLTRLLLDHPVVYYADLPEEELAYLHSQRTRLTQEIETACGLIAEIRSEGIAMVDPQRKLTDHAMPDEGTMGHAALLLAEFLIPHIATPGANDAVASHDAGVPILRVAQHLATQATANKARWRRDAQEPAGQQKLLDDVVNRLQSLGLLRRNQDSIFPQPALARYRLDPGAANGQG
jgi:uncharacterized protein (TIGR02678 family)